MSFTNYHQFKGSINNKNITELIKQLDYKIETYEERKEAVEKILGEDFFDIYFSKHFKTSISNKDEISEKNNICQSLSKISDYLLSSHDINLDLKEKKIVYKFYQTEEKLRQALEKDVSLEAITDKAQTEDNADEILHFLQRKNNNKKSKKISVNETDIKENSYSGKVLTDYNSLKSYLINLKNDENLRLKKAPHFSRGKISHIIKEVNGDMLLAKIQLSKVFGQTLRHELVEGQVVDWDCFDYTNFKHIKALLYSNNTTLSADNEISFLVLDLQNKIKSLLKRNKLKQRDLIIIKMVREGYLQEEIATELNITQERVNQKITQIAKRIALDFALEEKGRLENE